MATQIKIRRDTAANWASANPTPAQGEMCLETDTGRGKVGDGSSSWSALSYSWVRDVDSKADAEPAQTVQAGTAYTFAKVDARRLVRATAAAAKTFTVPPQSSVAWADGTILRVVNEGAAVLAVAAGSGVTVTNTVAKAAQYESLWVVRQSADAWLVVAGGGFPKAVVSGGTESTLTNPDGDGRNWKLCAFTGASGTLTCSRDGWAKVLVVGRGSSGYAGNRGSGGRVWEGWLWIPAGSYTVTVPQGATNVDGLGSSIAGLIAVGAVKPSPSDGFGALGTAGTPATGWTSAITGTSVEYARGVSTSVNPGDSGPNSGAVVAGVVYVRAEVA